MIADRIIGAKGVRFVVVLVAHEAEELLLLAVAVGHSPAAPRGSYGPHLASLSEELDARHVHLPSIVGVLNPRDEVMVVQGPSKAPATRTPVLEK